LKIKGKKEKEVEKEKNEYVLPTNVRPIRYQIELEPDLERFIFFGEEIINIEVLEQTSTIVLNAVELEVSGASLHWVLKETGIWNDLKQEALEIVMDPERETVTIRFAEPLEAQRRYQLCMNFRGALSDKLHGFYRSKYALPDGTERYMATTQFEAVDARRAFPCWDEPAYKAVFEVTLVVPQDKTALSNMPSVDEAVYMMNGRKKVRFVPSPKMSTYLLAFIVGDLESLDGQTKNGTLVRIWATPGKRDQCRFALETGIRVLEYYEEYFGIPYPLPKMDMVAIPDFAAGAMENWGLVTYRERILLVDSQKSSTATKQHVASVIAHELAHQWFGNLVTMQWWDDLWLNEGFASWMGDKAVDHLFPEWDTWTQFYASDTASGLALDGLKNTHPIEVPVRNPKEIGEIFDAISYSKGASVIRMLENYLGEKVFQQGLSRYLSEHSYGNTRTEDLWAALSQVSGKNVAEIMDTWTKQPGYPVVKACEVLKDGERALQLSQKRFLYDGENRKGEQTLWNIPMRLTVAIPQELGRIAKMRKQRVLMQTKRKTIALGKLPEDTWIKVNASQAGFFRVQYDEKLLRKLYPVIESRELSTLDRLGIENDVHALVRSGSIPVTHYLELVEHYRNETEYAVWAELAGGLSGIMGFLRNEEYSRELYEFVQDIFVPIASRLGWDPAEGECDLDALLRPLVIGQLGVTNDQDTVREATRRFSEFILNPQSLIPDLRGVVCSIVVTYGGSEAYESVLALYRSASLQEEKMRYAMTLARSQDVRLLQRTLEFALSQEVRMQDALSVIGAVAANPNGRDLAWEFVKARWQELDRIYGDSKYMLGRLIEGVVSGFSTEEKKREVAQFFDEHPVPGADRALKQSFERIDMNIKWLVGNRESAREWFVKRREKKNV
jgi:puromycin-sensitive aminopeptidase